MKVTSAFTYNKVLFNKDNANHLVIGLEAPKLTQAKKRQPICIVPVLDVSGSMGGPKLDYAKKSILKLIDHLQPGDFFGAVTFGTAVSVVVQLSEITQTKKEEHKAVIGKIETNGSTNFSGGMTKALELVNGLDAAPGMMLRIIMFTDGQANHGYAVTPEQILDLAGKTKDRASVSAFGYGTDCNQEMLTGLARLCNGNYAFINSPEDALSAFGKELGGLTSTYAQDIKITVKPANEHRVTGVISDVDVEDQDNGVVVKLSDILSEEKRFIVAEVNLVEQKQALPREVNVFDVTVSYEVFEDGKHVTKSHAIKSKVRFVKDGEQDTKPDKDTDQIVGLAQLVNAQIQAEKLAQSGNYAGAAAHLNAVGATFDSRGLEQIYTMSNNVSSSYGDAVTYASSSGYRGSTSRLMSRGAAASTSDTSAAAQVASVLRAAGGQSMSNSMQNETVSAFVDEVEGSFADPSGTLADVTGTFADQSALLTTTTLPVAKPSKSKSKSKRW